MPAQRWPLNGCPTGRPAHLEKVKQEDDANDELGKLVGYAFDYCWAQVGRSRAKLVGPSSIARQTTFKLVPRSITPSGSLGTDPTPVLYNVDENDRPVPSKNQRLLSNR